MASKEIITRIKNQLKDGYIDFNDTNDIEEMNYIRVAIYKLMLYEKALEISCDLIARLMPFDIDELVGTDYLLTKDKQKMKKYLLEVSEKSNAKDI